MRVYFKCRSEFSHFSEWHHWLVVNIPGNDISRGDVLSEYIGAGPPEKTGKHILKNIYHIFVLGLHRYVYLVYKQPGKIRDNEHGKLGFSGDKRGGWKIGNFAQKVY